tara:strand:+ start:1316 stop:1942 length:627 start_codon:yes stop_codon:yes gene_type:complete
MRAIRALDGVEVGDKGRYVNVTFTEHGEMVKYPKRTIGERHAAVCIRADYGGALGVSNEFCSYLDTALEVRMPSIRLHRWYRRPRPAGAAGGPMHVLLQSPRHFITAHTCPCVLVWQAVGVEWDEPEMQMNSGSGRHPNLYVFVSTDGPDDDAVASKVAAALGAAQDAFMHVHVAAFHAKEAAKKQRGRQRAATPAPAPEEDEDELID